MTIEMRDTVKRLRALSSALAAPLAGVLLMGMLLVAPAALAQGSATAPAERWEEIQYPPLPEQEVPVPKRVELPNGMVVMLLEDHELPLVEAVALVRTGSRLEPADKAGLAGLTGQVLRSGGTESMSSEELDEYLEDRAASIETSIGSTAGQASMSALAEDYPEVLRVFADVLRNPAFAEDELEVAKNQVNAGIARQNDDPQGITFREFGEVVYGEGSPYARSETYETVANVDRQDLVEWHETYFQPNRVVLGLVGDFDSEKALARVKEVFGDWEAGPAVPEGEGDVAIQESFDPGVYYVAKNDMTQANILMGHLGVERDNPDYYAIQAMNNILSGGFASRLFSNVRSAKGLAYTVFGSVGSNYDYPGLFQMFTTTKTETTGAAIEALLEEAENLTAKPPTAEELAKAKEGILNSFVFESDSAREILGQQLRFEYYGYPLDWLDRYRQGIEAVSLEEVRAAAAKYVHPERFAILVVGPEEGMDKPLSTYGEVTPVDITIPEPAAAKAEVTEEGKAQATQILDKAVDAMGGATVIDQVRALRSKGSVSQVTPQGTMDIGVASTYVFPDRMRQELTLPMGSMTMVVSGDAGFLMGPMGTQDLPASRAQAMRRSALRSPLAILKMRQDPAFTATALPAGELDGTPLERVQVEIAGDVAVVGIDAESGEIRQVVYQDQGPSGAPGEVVQTYSDYRKVDGLSYPFATVGTFDGEQISSSVTEEIEVNPEVADSEFEKPAGGDEQ